MKSGERIYGKNEVIYNEGDPSDAVYVVVSGRVQLFKATDDGPVVVASCGPIEMFGETGILEDVPRESGARAIQKTRVKCVSRDEFMVWMEHEPNAALRAMGLLVERLRTADAIIARSQGGERVTLAGIRPSFLGFLKDWIRRPRGSRAAAAGGGGGGAGAIAPPFVIGVSTVNNDIESGWTRALIALLDERSGITVREIAEPLQIEANPDQAQAAAAMLRARQVLGHEDGLDLLVWGDVHSEGYSLWFSPVGPIDDDRPGSFSLYLRLELPGDQEPPAGDLFYMAVLAAIEPLNDGQRNQQRQLLGAAYQALPAMPNGLPVTWSLEQQRTALTCCGHASATLAAMDGEPAWYDHAVEVYNAAINRLPRGESGMDEALLRKHLAGVLQAASDRRQDTDLLERAVSEYRSAAECLVKAVHPQEWAGAQNRLGQALYKLDLMTGQPALLKEAMPAFQAALQVFTRAEQPHRWADVMNNLAQVLQVYGDQMKSPEVLERAVDACRAALEFRSRGRAPLAWAASQNTLGTALFLLDKHRQSTEHLDEADAAYTAALEVYRQMGATRLAAVAEKNLAHVQRLNKIRDERRVSLPDWSDESGKSLTS